MKKKIEYIKTPTKFDYDAHVKNSYYGTTVSEAIPPQRNSTIASEIQTGLDRVNQTRIPMIEHEQKQTEAEIRAEDFSSKYLFPNCILLIDEYIVHHQQLKWFYFLP